MFGMSKKNSYDDTSVMEQGGKEYGSDIHGVAVSVNKIVWDMLKVLKEKQLYGFHFSAKLGIKNTIIIMMHEDREMLNKGLKALHSFQTIKGIIILAKVFKSKGSKKKVLEENTKGPIWKSKTGISTIIGTMILISVSIYYYVKHTQKDNKHLNKINTTIVKKEINIEKRMDVNIQILNALSKSFDNQENKKVKEVLAKVLEISTTTSILEKIPGYEKVEIDNDKVLSSYEDPNLKYVFKDGNSSSSMKELNEMAQNYARENNITQAKGILNELVQIGREAMKKGFKGDTGVSKNLNTLGDISLQEGDIQGAKSSYSEALAVDKQMATKYPREYGMRVARDLTNLGAINLFMNNKVKAKEFYKEAEKRYKRIVELYRNLAKKEPKEYTPSLAYALNNLASLYLNREQNLSRAIKPTQEALDIYKQLDKTEPKKHNDYLIFTAYRKASIYNKLNKFETAQKLYIGLIQFCNQEDRKKYQEYVAKSFNALAWIYTKDSKLRDFQKAKAQLNKAITIYKDLMKKSPDKFNHILSLSYAHRGYIATIEGKKKIAIKMYKKAVDTFDNFDNNISYALFLAKEKKYKDANRIFKSILKKYTKKEQQAYALKAYGEFYMNIDKAEGEKKLEESQRLYSEI